MTHCKRQFFAVPSLPLDIGWKAGGDRQLDSFSPNLTCPARTVPHLGFMLLSTVNVTRGSISKPVAHALGRVVVGRRKSYFDADTAEQMQTHTLCFSPREYLAIEQSFLQKIF